MPVRLFAAALALLSTLTLAFALDRNTVEIASKSGVHVFAVEMADTEAAREKGLMYRKSLPPGQGMLFDFHSDQPVRFWMKNTYIPLSIAFVDASGHILNIEDMRPQDESTHWSRGPALYAIEMRKGWFADKGIAAGDRVEGLVSR